MKKFFTLIIGLIIIAAYSVNAQVSLNTGTGVPWGSLAPSEQLLLNEDFTGFEFFHSDENPNDGNSDNMFDNDGTTIIYGYKNDTVEVPILGAESGKITYTFHQAAFAPEWASAYGYRDAKAAEDLENSENYNTNNVSNGFVELSRFDTIYSTIPTAHGYLEVDLRELDFVEVIQWSHSSTGGSKRGVMCKFSLDDGITWDTLRYQPGENGTGWASSFTKDPYTLEKTPNGYRCDPSGNGMTWEDGIYAENVMLRFGEAGGQTPRIHDLLVYGTYTATSASVIEKDGLKIYAANRRIHISEQAKVVVYNISGALVRQANYTREVPMNDMPNGIYLVKAQTDKQIRTAKVVIN